MVEWIEESRRASESIDSIRPQAKALSPYLAGDVGADARVARAEVHAPHDITCARRRGKGRHHGGGHSDRRQGAGGHGVVVVCVGDDTKTRATTGVVVVDPCMLRCGQEMGYI
jgi:hypothetical protein